MWGTQGRLSQEQRRDVAAEAREGKGAGRQHEDEKHTGALEVASPLPRLPSCHEQMSLACACLARRSTVLELF